MTQYSGKHTKSWPLEVKLLTDHLNVRECFFQAVSSSSRANFDYLVMTELSGIDTLRKLWMLFITHGISFIKLDVDSLADSQVPIPARK